MRGLFIAIGMFLALLTPAWAASNVFDTPKALLDFAYQPYATGKFQDDSGLLYSKALNGLFAAAEAGTSDSDDLGPVDFDVFVNGQDYQLSELAIGEAKPEAGGVLVPVTFKNFGEPQSLVFHLVKEGGGWKINDIESLTAGSTWQLTKLLAPDNSGGDQSAGDGSSDGAAEAPPDGTAANAPPSN